MRLLKSHELDVISHPWTGGFSLDDGQKRVAIHFLRMMSCSAPPRLGLRRFGMLLHSKLCGA